MNPNEAGQPGVGNALRAWLAAPGDGERLRLLQTTAGKLPIDLLMLERMPSAVLAACRAGGVPQIDGLRPAVRLALLVCGGAAPCGVAATPDEQRDIDVMPFQVQVAGDEVLIEIPQHGERRPGFGQPLYHQWVGGVQAKAIAVECSKLDHINSVFIAWLLQLVQSAKPVPVHIRKPKSQVAIQLRQLRLDHLMVIEA